jgi:hypothetical protein
MESMNEPPRPEEVSSEAKPETSAVTVAYCRACGKALTAETQRSYQGTVYCAEHLPQPATTGSAGADAAPGMGAGMGPGAAEWSPASAATVPPPPPGATITGTSPGLAFLLGLIPGVGAIYNGQYAKGFVHVLLLGILITLASESSGPAEGFFGLFIPIWIIYMAFEAYHTAKRRQMGEMVDEFSSIFPNHAAKGAPVLPLLLIGLGVLFLLNNLELIRIRQLVPYAGPLFLIGLGLYLLYARMKANAGAPVGEVADERR